MIPTKCAVCGKPLVYPGYGDKPMCFEGTGHTIGPPCTRREFDAAVRAAKLAAFPLANRMRAIGGWSVSGRQGIWKYSLLRPDTKEAIQASIVELGVVRWFLPDLERGREIESAGFVKGAK